MPKPFEITKESEARLKLGLKALIDEAVADAIEKENGAAGRVDFAGSQARGAFVAAEQVNTDADWRGIQDLAEAASREAGKELAKTSGSSDVFAGCVDLAGEVKKASTQAPPIDTSARRRALEAQLAKCGFNDLNAERIRDELKRLGK